MAFRLCGRLDSRSKKLEDMLSTNSSAATRNTLVHISKIVLINIEVQYLRIINSCSLAK